MKYYAFLLLLGIGISNIGEWIYFLALNLIVLDKTSSPLAVTGLYLIKPIATLLTNLWAGSLIDRLNKRHLMIFLDLFRVLVIFSLLFTEDLITIYAAVLIVNMSSAIFEPVSITYMTKLIPETSRQQFNSILSLVTSGAFFIGPAISGLLFLISDPEMAILINAVALLFSGMITWLLPNVDMDQRKDSMNKKFSSKLLREDWHMVFTFSQKHKHIMGIYLLSSCVMVILPSGIDSLEVSFTKVVLSLSNSEYSILVSIAGMGIVVGALINTLIGSKVAIYILIGAGTIFVSIGYIIYAYSSSFLSASVGFFSLAFFISFANTGILTYFQYNIPVYMMGRIASMFQFFEAVLIMLVTTLIGVAAEKISIQISVQIGGWVMTLLAIALVWSIYKGFSYAKWQE
ncbi:MFS transporter [Gracilibacillus caseinilyticus]|uniref:MFS transporter n=1 Tax=Gracilibacillus caseinilyticus TaxID=2932256 RepID=A0ABY4EUD1_9BACI|nr:MFS transporter [Gracilibacillus caseinilyticus]UOQ47671.1 MFS transporter [Gracilibacillus caseinilyticus]